MKQSIFLIAMFLVFNFILATISFEIEQKYLMIIASLEVAISALFFIRKYEKEESVLRETNKELKKENKKITDIVTKDELTTAFSRFAFFDWFKKNKEFLFEHNFKLSLIYIDLDHFKKINDTYGHLVGDEILKESAKDIISHARGNDFLVRLGGDEFVLVCFENKEKVIKIAKRIKERWENKEWSHVSRVSCSMGVAEWHAGEKLKSLMRRADIALYKAKNNGRNNVVESK